MKKKLFKLQKKLNLNFKNLELLERALTHKSYDSINNYEKLEFLGDRVLGLVISKKLLELYPEEREGVLDKKLASLVNKNSCFKIFNSLEIHEFILIGNTKKKNLIENKIISDCSESIIGAVYLDKGFDYVEKFILRLWQNLIISSNITIVDAKTRLQEYSLKKFKTLPIYKVISNTGPRHKPKFKVGVKLKNTKLILAVGSSKKSAEQSAADECLKNLKDL
tara:strand:- start:1129 stop:1794 length:666 start_codon:yes stop_codon:yes gene_type:complete